MTTAADYLHRQIFGSHSHPCPGEYCDGAERQCSEQYDCQPGPKLCANCAWMLDLKVLEKERSAAPDPVVTERKLI